MLSVHCIFLIKFYITRNQYVRRTRQFSPKWPILRKIFQKILTYIAYTLLPYWKHVHTYQKQLETKLCWVRKNFKGLGRVLLGISHFTGECACSSGWHIQCQGSVCRQFVAKMPSTDCLAIVGQLMLVMGDRLNFISDHRLESVDAFDAILPIIIGSHIFTE